MNSLFLIFLGFIVLGRFGRLSLNLLLWLLRLEVLRNQNHLIEGDLDLLDKLVWGLPLSSIALHGAVENDLFTLDNISTDYSIWHNLPESKPIVKIVRNVRSGNFPRTRLLEHGILEHFTRLPRQQNLS